MNVLKSVKQTVNIYLILIKYYLCFFKPVLRKQIRNPKNIPIIINNFNQLFYLKQLINKLQIFNIKTIVILDNNSTFPPLLKYYEDIKNEVKIIRLTKNRGHLAFWKTEYVFKQYLRNICILCSFVTKFLAGETFKPICDLSKTIDQ